MSVRPLPEREDTARYVPIEGMNAVTTRRVFIEPVPVGTYVAMTFRVTGYEPDCDGSALAQVEHVDRRGEATGWEADHIGLSPNTDVILDAPGDLHKLAEARRRPQVDAEVVYELGRRLSAALKRGAYAQAQQYASDVKQVAGDAGAGWIQLDEER